MQIVASQTRSSIKAVLQCEVGHSFSFATAMVSAKIALAGDFADYTLVPLPVSNKMKFVVTILAAAVTSALFAGCATPTVVESKQANDRTMSCDALKTSYAEAKDFETKARKERGVTGTNVAAAILFWPAMIGTYKNTEEAIDAAKDRQKHLESIAAEKKCNNIG
jgi:hypothetical protein